ncbi:MAG: type II secretion system F family protein, partial [Candidatus Niyogibacteria bacterium]|nr:type II secretion system F family protein [Candidatus Niyogibacteria bacterium]
EEALKLTAEHLERDYDLRRKVRGAFIYPAIIVITMAVIGILMLVYVVPTMVATFEELGVKLPFTTMIIVVVSRFLIDRWILSSILLAVSAALFVAGLGSERGKRVLAAISLKLPVISEMVKKINSARASRTLSSLISSGVEIVEALDITKDVVQNVRFKKVLAEARDEIQKGNPISKVFIENSGLFPLLVGEMIAVGEETGKLSEMLSRLAGFYEDDVAESTKALSTIVEPVLMIIIGSIVGFFAISMIQPIYSVVGGL